MLTRPDPQNPAKSWPDPTRPASPSDPWTTLLATCLCIYINLELFFEQVRELEGELEATQRRERDVFAENKKLQRLLSELRAQSDEDHRLVVELTEQVNTLQLKLGVMKRQLLEAVRTHPFLVILKLRPMLSPKHTFCQIYNTKGKDWEVILVSVWDWSTRYCSTAGSDYHISICCPNSD